METNGRIFQEFDGKTIFITGATGFLAKLMVEKLLRLQPNLKKLFLLVRASCAQSAQQRLRQEIIDSDLFRVLREKWGEKATSFLSSKLIPIPGDVSSENLGIMDADLFNDICEETDFIINMAATTNFNERYDVAMDINVFGTMNVLNFAKRCPNLKLLLHVSTAFVHATSPGLLLEEPFDKGKILKDDAKALYLDIEAEKKLVEETIARLQAQNTTDKELAFLLKDLGTKRAKFHGWENAHSFTKAMGEMMIRKFKESVKVIIARPTIVTSTLRDPFPGWIEGLRTFDSIFAAYGTGKLKFFVGDPDSIVDLIPGDMVVNSILIAMVFHCDSCCNDDILIYQVGSSLRNPIRYKQLKDIGSDYLKKNPLLDSERRPVNLRELWVLGSMNSFRRYIQIRYLPFLMMLKLVNVVFCNRYQSVYANLTRKINSVVRFAEIYKPYIFFEGIFDDANTENLRRRNKMNSKADMMLDFDPRHIDWEHYFREIHFPGLRKYVLKQ